MWMYSVLFRIRPWAFRKPPDGEIMGPLINKKRPRNNAGEVTLQFCSLPSLTKIVMKSAFALCQCGSCTHPSAKNIALDKTYAKTGAGHNEKSLRL